jgi:hypothetical protein
MALFPVGAQDVNRDLLAVYGMDIMQGLIDVYGWA